MSRFVSTVLADPVNVTPNRNGLPGVGEAEKIAGALLTFGLIAAVAGIAISAIVWAIAHNSANPHLAGKGKTGVIVACIGALLIGGADLIVNFFASAGGSI
jgi:hypothetical protein